MERRKFVIGAGALASGSAAALGTGAFSSVEADRDATVDVVNDSDGYLSLTPDPKDTHGNEYVEETDGTIEFTFDRLNPDATTTIDDLLEVANEGTQSVEVSVDFSPDDDQDRVDLTPDLEDGITIDEGHSEIVDIEFDTTGLGEGEYFQDVTVTFNAEAQ